MSPAAFPFVRVLILVLAATAFSDTKSAPVPSADLQKRYDAACADFDARSKKFHESLAACATNDEIKALQPNRPGRIEMPAFEIYAAQAKGTELAADAWMRVAEIASDFRERDPCVRAFDRLIDEHAASPVLVRLPRVFWKGLDGYVEPLRLEAAMDKVAKANPLPTIRAEALYAAAKSMAYDPKTTPERTAAARALLATLIETYPAVIDFRERTFASLAHGVLNSLDRLAVGRIAPDFEAVDENGVKFKLSDYRGQIVLIDFWGTW